MGDLAIHMETVELAQSFDCCHSVNIGNARLYGMESDLGLVGNQYQTAVSLLFVTYILSELPSNLVLKKFRPSRWLSFMVTRCAASFLIDLPFLVLDCQSIDRYQLGYRSDVNNTRSPIASRVG